MRSRALALSLSLALCACHHGGGEAAPPPDSCVIEHDGGVTQCFDEIGRNAKKFGEKLCDEMHGEHTYHRNEPCPPVGLVGSCTKSAGTELERVERCYRDAPGCEHRCQRSGGTFAAAP